MIIAPSPRRSLKTGERCPHGTADNPDRSARRSLASAQVAHHSLSVPAAQWEALPFSFYTGRVLAVALDGSVETIAKVPGQPSGIRFLPDGGMLIVSMRDRRILRRELDATLVKH